MRPDLYRPPNTEPGPIYGARSSRGSNRWVTLLILLAVVVGLGAAGWKKFGPSVAGGGWLHDLDDGLDAAAKSGKPVLVLYTADWCPPCRQLKRDVLNNRQIAAFLEQKFVLVKIDLSNRRGPNNKLAEDAGVRGLPTMIVYNYGGTEVNRITGGGAIGSWMRGRAAR